MNSEAYSGEGCEVSASSPWTSKIYDFKWVLCPYGCWALSKYKFGLSWCLGVCLFVSNKRLNGYTDWAQIFFCGISHDPREGLCMIKISKISLQQNSILIKVQRTRIFCSQNLRIFVCFCFTIQRENFTIEIEDGREAHIKPSSYKRI